MVNTHDNILENGQNSSFDLGQSDLNYWLLFFKTFSFILVLMNKCFQIWYNNVWILLKPQFSSIPHPPQMVWRQNEAVVLLYRSPFSTLTWFRLFFSQLQVGLLEKSHKSSLELFPKREGLFSLNGFGTSYLLGKQNGILTKCRVAFNSWQTSSFTEKKKKHIFLKSLDNKATNILPSWIFYSWNGITRLTFVLL